MKHRKTKDIQSPKVNLKITSDSIDKFPEHPYSRYFEKPKVDNFRNRVGSGRYYGTGGEACDYCGACFGTADFCPFMD